MTLQERVEMVMSLLDDITDDYGAGNDAVLAALLEIRNRADACGEMVAERPEV